MTRITTAVVMLASIAAFNATVRAETTRPYILFVLIDDMGNGDLSCFGGTRTKTPEIDRLASEGIKFTRFYDAAPICSPSRCGFLTGQYPNRWRITSFLASRKENHDRGIADWLDPKAPTVARFLSQQGYYIAHVGKWHLGGQREIDDAPLITAYGFDASLTSFEGLGERIIPIFEPVKGKPFHHPPSESNAKVGKGPVHKVPRHEVTARYVDRAMEEIKKARAANKPFYINLWTDDVHSPEQAPPSDRGDGSKVDQYLGVMREMDRQFGRMFKFIRDDPTLRDNTLIVVSSDNGPEPGLGSAGKLRGFKGQLYEGGIRNPLIVWFPGAMEKSAVRTTNDATVVCGIDLCPTFLMLAHAMPQADVPFDGVDMSAVFVGKSNPKRGKPVMWVRPPDRPGPKNAWPDLAIRDGDFKLLVKRDGSSPELFNVIDDANEAHDVAGMKPELVRRLADRVIQWDREIAGKSR
jgi:uncharacterized sulfatase